MLKVESGVSFRDIIRARERSFASRSHLRDYGCETFVSRGIREYEEILELEDTTLRGLVEAKIAEHPEGINILDIGCGKAAFLKQVKKEYPQANAFGLSAYNYRGVLGSVRIFLRIDPRIDYRVEDAHKLTSIYPGTRFDIVVSVAALEHIADPLNVVKQAYRLVKPGGIIMFNSPERLTRQQAEDLQRYWDLFGIKTKFGRDTIGFKPDDPIMRTILIEKAGAPKLPLPFKYVRSFWRTSNYGIGYELDMEAIDVKISSAAA